MKPKRTPQQWAMAAGGFAMLAVASPCVIAMLHDIITQADNLQGALIVGIFMGFVGIAGIVMMGLGLRKPEAAPFTVDQALEREVLSIARSHDGRLTVSELALQTRLTIDECQQLMAYFEEREVVRTYLSDGGDIVYVFVDFTVDKAAAIDPLDDEAVFDAALEDELEEEAAPSVAPQQARNEEW